MQDRRPNSDNPQTAMVSDQSCVVSDGPLTMSVNGITLSGHPEPKKNSRYALPLLTVGAQCVLPARKPVQGLRRPFEGSRRSWLRSSEKMKLQLPRIDEEHVIAEQGTSVGQNDFRSCVAHVTGNGYATTKFRAPLGLTPVAMTPVAMTPVAAATGLSDAKDRMSMEGLQRRLESLRPEQPVSKFRAAIRPVIGTGFQPDVTQNGLLLSSSSLPIVNLNRSMDEPQGVASVSVTASLPVPLWRRSLTLIRAEVDDPSSQQHGTSMPDRKSQHKRVHYVGRPCLPLRVPMHEFSRRPALSKGHYPGRSVATRRPYAAHGSLSMRNHVSTSFSFGD